MQGDGETPVISHIDVIYKVISHHTMMGPEHGHVNIYTVESDEDALLSEPTP